MTYHDSFDANDVSECKDIARAFLEGVKQCYPDMMQKVKLHLLLHLVDCMVDFGLQCTLTQKGRRGGPNTKF